MTMDSSISRQAGLALLEQRYALESLLGTGSAGRVYRARQRSTGQAVAVKVLELEHGPEQKRERSRQRFRREMTICGRLAHHDIVRLIDFGEDGEALYSVFELVHGRTLAQLLESEGALTLARSQRLLGQLLQVLSYAHTQGVIHRDLKPSNLMVIGEGEHERIKVLDFGVSAIHGGLSGVLTRLTLNNEIVGTPAYAAPEQLRGDASTPRSDLYAWGLILLECLTGENVMGAHSLGEIFQRQLSPAPVPVHARLEAHALGSILRSVLEKNPARRATSAQEVLARFTGVSLLALQNDAGYLADGPACGQRAAFAPITRTISIAQVGGERRQVTALACRLSLQCASPDPDTTLLDAYRTDLFALCASTVEGLGGALVGGCGDISLFCFGTRRARDTDARMALRAALELGDKLRARSAVLQAQSAVSVCFRAGLHTGRVNAGEGKHDGVLAQGIVASTAVALARREAGVPEVSVTASHAFTQLAEKFGQFEQGPDLSLSWSTSRLLSYHVIGESFADEFEHGTAPMVGREAELVQIIAASESAREHGCLLLIRAEPGMGKSRLAHEFASVVRSRGGGPLTLRCVPELEPIALGPVLAFTRALLGLSGGAADTCALLGEALSAFSVDLASAVPLLCAWLAIPIEAPFTNLPHAPQMQRAMLVALLVSLVHQRAQKTDGYLFVEDLHWADQHTRGWLALYARTLARGTGFALVTSRPEPAVEDEVAATTISLDRLSDRDALALLAGLPAAAALQDVALARIVELADGVPLFVEELARAVANPTTHGELREVPATLRDLLTSRLDELGSAKETAQFAAAIGREFDIALLAASIAKDAATLHADVQQLVSAGLVVVRRHAMGPSYKFRHALVRDAAYESLTQTSLVQVHGAVADALLREFGAQVSARPDVIARHLEIAGRPFESQRYWLASGRQSLRDTSYDAARASFERGLMLVHRCPEGDDRLDAELDHLNALLAAHVVKLGFGAPALPGILTRARVLLARGTASSGRALPVLWGQYLLQTVHPDFAPAYATARQIVELAQAAGDHAFRVAGYSALVRCAFWTGSFDEVETHFARIDTQAGPDLGRQLLQVIGEDSYTAGVSFAALAAIVRGQGERGIALLEELLRTEELSRVPGQTEGSLAQAAFGYLLRGMYDPTGEDLKTARAYGAQARDSAGRLGFPFWAGYAGLIEASARVYQGDPGGTEQIRAAMQGFVHAGADIGFGWYYCTIAHGCLLANELDAASEALAAAQQHVTRSGERFFALEQARLEARLRHARDPRDQRAKHALAEAITDACARGGRLFLTRARADLAELFGT